MPKLDLLPGTLDLLVLQMLASHGPAHGYGIGKHLEFVSGDQLRLNPGTIYASLVRLQHSGWIRAEWGVSENQRRAKFYSITPAGRRQLRHEADSWTRLATIVDNALRPVEAK